MEKHLTKAFTHSRLTHNRPGTGQWLNITRASVNTQVTQEERSTSPPPSASQPRGKGRKASTPETTCYRQLTSYWEASAYSASSTALGELDSHGGRHETGPGQLISDINFLGRTHSQKVGVFPDDINICISELYGSEKVGPHHVCGHHLIYWEPE